MAQNYKHNKRSQDGTVRFLFVGLRFRRKGGPELLAAFAKLPDKNARLTVISQVPNSFKEKYSTDSRITFLSPQPRSVLHEEIYPTHDVFVFPSLLETLGVVILEALSYGMGIITTDLYATREMVKDGKNRILLNHPFLKNKTYNNVSLIDPVSSHEKRFSKKYLTYQKFYKKLSEDTLAAMQTAIKKKGYWQTSSYEHFDANYAPRCWDKKFKEIVSS